MVSDCSTTFLAKGRRKCSALKVRQSQWGVAQASQLHVVDVRNPAQPVETAGFDSGWGSSATVVGDTASVAGWDEGLVILDVSTPSCPVRLGHYREALGDHSLLPPGATGKQTMITVTANKNLACVTYQFGVDHGTWVDIVDSGILVLDVSDPENPRQAHVYREMGSVTSVVLAGDLLLTTDKSRGLYILSMEQGAGTTKAPLHRLRLETGHTFLALESTGAPVPGSSRSPALGSLEHGLSPR